MARGDRDERPYGIAEAFGYAWEKYQEQLGPILVGVLVLLGVSLVLGLLWVLVVIGLGLASGGSDAGILGILLVTAVFGVATVVLGFLIQAGIIRAGLAIVDGHRLEASTLLATDRLGTVVVGSLLVGLGTAVGFALLVIPGLVFMFFTSFFMLFILDRGMGAVESIRASFSFVNDNLADVFVLFIAVYVANAIGSFLFGIGLLVSFPVTVIAQTWAFRRLQGRPVVA